MDNDNINTSGQTVLNGAARLSGYTESIEWGSGKKYYTLTRFLARKTIGLLKDSIENSTEK
jgi:hypothetical protein